MNTTWTEKEIEWLIQNYQALGSRDCAHRLKKTPSQIKSKKDKLLKKGITLHLNQETILRIRKRGYITRSRKHQYAVAPEQFTNPRTKEIAYILGLLWSDGYILNKPLKSQYAIRLSMVESDLSQLKALFLKTGKWRCRTIKQNNRKPQMIIETNNKDIVHFLECNDYTAKSVAPATKILAVIPKNLHPYWFRGLVDGDGCFYFNAKNHSRQFCLSSSYDQNWDYMKALCEHLGIKYSIYRAMSKKTNHKSSSFRVTNKEGVSKLGSYIYINFVNDKIGLLRKYNKFQTINQFNDDPSQI